MLPETLLAFARRRKPPDGLHLLSAVLAPHLGVVERVLVAAAFRSFARPQNHFRRVGERPPSQVGRRIGLLPYDVVEQPKSVLPKRHTNAGIDVQRPRYPDRACRLQNTVALGRPHQIELVVGFQPSAAVPLALVHAYHSPRHAGDPAIGEQIGRVGPYAIHAFVWNAFQKVQRVAQIERDVSVRRCPGRRQRGCERVERARSHNGLILDQIMRSCQDAVGNVASGTWTYSADVSLASPISPAPCPERGSPRPTCSNCRAIRPVVGR